MNDKVLFVKDKGNKEKNVRFSEDAAKDGREYLEVRKDFVKGKVDDKYNDYLFFGVNGKPWADRWFSDMINRRAEELKIVKYVAGKKRRINSRAIRRSEACQMSLNGAPIQYIAHFYDHSNINTTWQYIRHVREQINERVFDKYHPRGRKK